MWRFPFAFMCALLCLLSARQLQAHCEVPCGVYGDQARFEKMLENTQTISKAIAGVEELVAGEHTALTVNQAVRWVTTKDEHATDTQHIIAQYFMTQRIKPEDPDYTKKLTAAHAVMVAAMKCKQDANPATADALKQAIYKFYTAYTGKQPNLEPRE